MSIPSHAVPSATDFSGLWIPLITPFRHGDVDHPALVGLVRHLAQQGIRGFVVCGSTGEAAALSEAEQLAVLHTVREAAPGLPIIMGLSGYHLGDTLQWVGRVTAAGNQPPLHGLLVPAPHYIRPAQGGLLHWFRTIADTAGAQGVPTLLYDIPARTGVRMELATLLALAEHPHIRGVKDCGGDAGKTLALIADARLQVLAGDDLDVFATVAAGGAGSISAAAHFATARFAAVIEHLRAGQLHEAQHAWRPLPALIAAAFGEPNPAVIKAGLASQGWVANELRRPMVEASDGATRRLISALAACGT